MVVASGAIASGAIAGLPLGVVAGETDAIFSSTAAARSTASGVLTTGIPFSSAATAESSAYSAIDTGINLAGAAASVSIAGGTISPTTLTQADLYAIDALIAARIGDIAAAVLGAAQASPIHADARAIKGQTIIGTGTQSDPWGPS